MMKEWFVIAGAMVCMGIPFATNGAEPPPSATGHLSKGVAGGKNIPPAKGEGKPIASVSGRVEGSANAAAMGKDGNGSSKQLLRFNPKEEKKNSGSNN